MADDQRATEGTPPLPDGCKFVRLVWCDAAGIRRTRVVPAARWAEVCRNGVGVAFACTFLPASGDACPPDPAAKPVGEMRLLPAPGTLRRLPWHAAHALALVTMHREVDLSGVPWECCPRSALARVLQRARERHGLSLQVGFESEFILLDKARQQAGAGAGLPPPLEESVYCQSSAFDGAAAVLDAMCEALGELGIGIDQLHPESAPGQYEIATQHGEAMQACDEVLLTREAITGVAARHGLVATFLPKLWADAASNGAHVHFSIWQDGVNLLSSSEGGELSASGEHFLAGVLHHLPALLCFTAPSTNSYRRLQPSCWTGAFQVWGMQNREAALRVCGTPGQPESRNCEFKGFDATANPYLGLAAIVVAGMDGLERKLKLPPALDVDPGTLSTAELARAGIKRLPANLGQALEALRHDTDLRSALEEVMGETLVRAFLVVRAVELKAFGRKSIKEEALALYTRY